MRLPLLVATVVAAASCLLAPTAAKVFQKPLPYAVNALEPVISAKSLEAHYRLHARYVERTNELIHGTVLDKLPLSAIILTAPYKSELVGHNFVCVWGGEGGMAHSAGWLLGLACGNSWLKDLPDRFAHIHNAPHTVQQFDAGLQRKCLVGCDCLHASIGLVRQALNPSTNTQPLHRPAIIHQCNSTTLR
jgi:hypothetical protein